MRRLTCCGVLVLLTGCAHPRPVQEDSRADLLRPVSGSSQTNATQSPPASGRKNHGHLYMGSGFGGNHV